MWECNYLAFQYNRTRFSYSVETGMCFLPSKMYPCPLDSIRYGTSNRWATFHMCDGIFFLFSFCDGIFGAEKFGRKKIIKFFFFFLQKLIILFFFSTKLFVERNHLWTKIRLLCFRLRKYYISEGIFRMHNAFWPTQFFTSQQGKERTFTAHPSAQVVILLEAALKLHLLCR